MHERWTHSCWDEANVSRGKVCVINPYFQRFFRLKQRLFQYHHTMTEPLT